MPLFGVEFTMKDGQKHVLFEKSFNTLAEAQESFSQARESLTLPEDRSWENVEKYEVFFSDTDFAVKVLSAMVMTELLLTNKEAKKHAIDGFVEWLNTNAPACSVTRDYALVKDPLKVLMLSTLLGVTV